MTLFLLLACSTEPATDAVVETPMVEETEVDIAVDLANTLDAEGDIDAALADRDMTRDDLDDLMYDISADPTLRADYLARTR